MRFSPIKSMIGLEPNDLHLSTDLSCACAAWCRPLPLAQAGGSAFQPDKVHDRS